VGADDEATVPAAERTASGRRTLLVIVGDIVVTHELPARGAIEVGRAAEAGLRVDHPSISRRHLKLWLGDGVDVEDLGGANGTTLRGARLAPGARTRLDADEVLTAGDVALVVQTRGPRAPAPRAGEPGVVLQDEAMIRLHALAARVARGKIPVLVVGETGAGKEVLSELVHRASPRGGGPLVRINCAALAETLVESEVFGHEKGAFTGAGAARRGLLEAADGGTVMLDEVGELPLPIQAKLLRVLEDGLVLPVGGTTPRKIDVRFVAATNRDLDAEVAAGRFRSDLYFRIAGVVLEVPPLRARLAELEPLAHAMLARAAADAGRGPLRLSPAALARLRAHSWPGNVRELRLTMERAALIAPGDVVEPEHLGLRAPPARAETAAPPVAVVDDEHQRILDALAACAGNQRRAAERLGMSLRTLVKRLDQYGVPRPKKTR
jgi:DNA-binding NtrC family response regulator